MERSNARKNKRATPIAINTPNIILYAFLSKVSQEIFLSLRRLHVMDNKHIRTNIISVPKMPNTSTPNMIPDSPNERIITHTSKPNI